MKAITTEAEKNPTLNLIVHRDGIAPSDHCQR